MRGRDRCQACGGQKDIRAKRCGACHKGAILLTKVCGGCKVKLPINSFSIRTDRGIPRPRSQCKACDVITSKAWEEANPEKHRRHVLKKRARLAGVHEDQLEATVDRYINTRLCPICLKPMYKSRSKAFDHNHLTGQFRGIICSSCNTGLGRFGDDPETLQRALEYLLAQDSEE